MSNSVTTLQQGPVTVVTLSRPQACNAVDAETAQRLYAALAEFDADTQARLAVFHGAHGHFCAGWDLKYGASLHAKEQTRRPFRELDFDPAASPASGMAARQGTYRRWNARRRAFCQRTGSAWEVLRGLSGDPRAAKLRSLNPQRFTVAVCGTPRLPCDARSCGHAAQLAALRSARTSAASQITIRAAREAASPALLGTTEARCGLSERSFAEGRPSLAKGNARTA